jgi:hypothetical protein
MGEKLVNKIKAIVLNLLLRRFFNVGMVLKVITKVITDVGPKCIP